MAQTATFISILHGVMAKMKLPVDPASVANIDVQPYQAWAVNIETRCREAYEYANWRSLILTEQRTSNASGVIAFDQQGQTRIGKTLEPDSVFVSDPRVTVAANPIRHIVTADGLQLASGYESTAVWIQFRRAAPRFTTTQYVEGANQYQPGQVVFWPMGNGDLTEQLYGDCYEARQNSAGTGFYWDQQIIPIEMKPWLVEAGYADALIMNQQRDRGLQHLETIAYPALHRSAKANTAQVGNYPKAKAFVP